MTETQSSRLEVTLAALDSELRAANGTIGTARSLRAKARALDARLLAVLSGRTQTDTRDSLYRIRTERLAGSRAVRRASRLLHWRISGLVALRTWQRQWRRLALALLIWMGIWGAAWAYQNRDWLMAEIAALLPAPSGTGLTPPPPAQPAAAPGTP